MPRAAYPVVLDTGTSRSPVLKGFTNSLYSVLAKLLSCVLHKIPSLGSLQTLALLLLKLFTKGLHKSPCMAFDKATCTQLRL